MMKKRQNHLNIHHLQKDKVRLMFLQKIEIKLVNNKIELTNSWYTIDYDELEVGISLLIKLMSI